MIDGRTFDLIRHKHGGYASWAVWASPTGGPKSNVGDRAALDPDANPGLLAVLRPKVVMLGLNLARSFPDQPLANFHDPSPRAQDYRIRFAFAETPYYGAYMTDLVKGVVTLDSKHLVRLVTISPGFIADSVTTLLDELDDVGAVAPTIIAFGTDTYRLAIRHLPATRYARLVGVMHYSHYISKEAYREAVLRRLEG